MPLVMPRNAYASGMQRKSVSCGMCMCLRPGVSNSFLVSTRSKEALLYNDNSVNENGHAATAFRILLQPACNFARDFDPEEFSFFRRLVIAISETMHHMLAAAHAGSCPVGGESDLLALIDSPQS